MQYLEYLVKIITEKASNRNYAVMLNLLSEINAASTSFLTQSHGQFESKFLVGRKMYAAALQTETLQTTINFRAGVIDEHIEAFTAEWSLVNP